VSRRRDRARNSGTLSAFADLGGAMGATVAATMRYLPALLSAILVLPLLSLSACGGDDDDDDDGADGSGSEADAAGGSGDAGAPEADAGEGEGDAQAGEDLELEASDFTCIKDGTRVHQFFMSNPLGHLDQAIAVADSPRGGTYPVGTIIQLIPQEAMVKRAAGWNPETSDWEFFLLAIDGDQTTIEARGGAEVRNPVGSCFECHAMAEPQWDLVCEDDHGCEALPIDDLIIQMLQDADTRCP
jgi:hypothetical protein